MKNGNTMNKRVFAMSIVRTMCLSVFVLALLACEQPFKAGLGIVVDIRAPAVYLDSPEVGDYITGRVEFRGHANDDYKITSIQFRVTALLAEGATNPYQNYRDVSLAPNGTWTMPVETVGVFKDGDFVIRLLVVDDSGKTTETNDIGFILRNNAPQISLSTPKIVPGSESGMLAGDKRLNLDWYTDKGPLPSNETEIPNDTGRKLGTGGYLVGMIRDSYDIYKGPRNDSTGQFPPGLRMWLISETYENGGFPLGEIPNTGSVPWIDLVENTNYFMTGVGTYSFMYILPDEYPYNFYALQVRAQGASFKRNSVGLSFNYPENLWSESVDDEDQYVLIYLRPPENRPSLSLWELEDINPGPGNSSTWNGLNYGTIKDPLNPTTSLNTRKPHPYIVDRNPSKNGDFTLRVWASHPDGIQSAEAYFEKDDSSIRGRFIWDPATETLWTGWDMRNNTQLSTDPSETSELRHTLYSQWGYRDLNPNSAATSLSNGITPTTSTFIFTYKRKGENRISNSENIHPLVRGRSKVHLFTGNNQSEWEAGKKSGLWPSASDMGSRWQEMNGVLPDGTYKIEVYTRSARTNSPIREPFPITLKIDSGAPKVELFGIDTSKRDGDAYIVNGVIEPRLSIVEDRVEDSGRRDITNDDDHAAYYASGTGYTYEERFILVEGQNDRGLMKAVIDGWGGAYDYWPPAVSSSADSLSIGDVQVWKHGAIGITGDGRARFKTSPTGLTRERLEEGWSESDESDALQNGDYYLFVFARDRAFNVRVQDYHLRVDHSSDYPEIISTSLNPDVTDPNPDFDGTPSGFKDDNGNVRNKMSDRDLVMSLIDDDYLDISSSARDIEFVGSYINTSGKVTAYTDTNRIIKLPLLSFFGGPVVDPLRERAGRISQSDLLTRMQSSGAYNDLLDGHPANNRLPDGLYQITVIVRDDPTNKLKMIGSANPLAMQVEKPFWIAVDTKSPEISNVTPASGMYIKADAPITITGKVSDRNGPVTYVPNSARISGPLGATITPPPENLTRIGTTVDATLWEGEFSFVVDLKGRDGEYNIEMQFVDRFGNPRTMQQRYVADTTPPTVSLSRPISTFDRQGIDLDADRQGVARDFLQLDKTVDGIRVNKSRLANEVISFTINPYDEVRVAGVRWWLLPANRGADADGLTTNDSGGTVTDYNAWPSQSVASQQLVYLDTVGTGNEGAYGEVDMTSRRYTIEVDSEKLVPQDGEYILRIIARDEAGNVSVPFTQSVFFLQEEDKPFFGDIRPNGPNAVVDGANLFVQGFVSDDDGFGDNSHPAIKIWIKNGTSPSGLDINSDSALTTAGYSTPVTVPVNRTGNPRTINLTNVDLKALFPNPGLWDHDGEIYYVIEATDATAGKIKIGQEQLVSRSYRTLYSFVYDNNPPEIELTYPAQDTSFGLNSDQDFSITGYIRDPNLKRNDNGHYYFKYSLDTWQTQKEWELAGDNVSAVTFITRDGVSHTTDNGDAVEVRFTIPASRVAPLISAPNADTSMFVSTSTSPSPSPSAPKGFRDDNFQDRNYILTVSAEDKSGKESPFIFSFTKDTRPPEFSFANIAKEGVPLDSTHWWNGSAYHDRWDWLLDNKLGTVYYYSGEPELRGVFSDKTSDIDTASFRYAIDVNGSSGTLQTPAAGTVEWSGDGKNQNWRIYLTHNGKSKEEGGVPLPDGVHSISFTISDTSGNVLNDGKMYGFRIDSAEPRIGIDAVQHSVLGSATGVVTLSGTATDANIKDVRLKIVPSGGATVPVLPETIINTFSHSQLQFRQPDPAFDTLPLIAEKVTWSYTLPNTVTLNPGSSYDVTVYAVDQNNLESEKAVWTFTVDSTPPTFSFDSLSASGDDLDLSALLSPPGNYHVLSSGNLIIRGIARDNHSPITALHSKIWQWNYETGEWAAKQDWTSIWTPNPTTPSKEVNWSKDLGPSGLSLADGLYRMKVRAKDSSWTESGTNQDGTDPWLSTDIGNPVESGYVYFFYDRANPDPFALASKHDDESHLSSERNGGKLVFTGTAKDENRIKEVTATVFLGTTDVSSEGVSNRVFTVTPQGFSDIVDDIWTLNIGVNPGNPIGAKDNFYTIEFKATDLAGRSATTRKAFFLDNTPPVTGMTAPALRTPQPSNQNNASEDVSGGQTYVISGTNEDTSGNSSESGVHQMWFHLGYLNGALPTKDTLVASVIGTGKEDSANSDSVFDTKANYTASGDSDPDGNAWFKYQSGFLVPTGFKIENHNTMNWRMEVPYADPLTHAVVGGLKQYAESIIVKGRTYNGSNPSLKMSELISGTDGLYRMPMWIRVTDIAGNVSYFSREIWIYPDGDIPRVEIKTPAEPEANSPAARQPRGGAVPVDGVATHITSVYGVAYRVFADRKVSRLNNLLVDDTSAPDNTTVPVTLTGSTNTVLGPGNAMYGKIPAGDRAGWYIASLETTSGATVPWNFIINTNDEITTLISSQGFYSGTGLQATGTQQNDTIRVFLEVIAFSGTGEPVTISQPPYSKRVFYLKRTAPQIQSPLLRTVNNQPYYGPNSPTPNPVGGIWYEPYSATGRAVRGEEFAIRATLNGNGSNISRVQIRRSPEQGTNNPTGWFPIWENGSLAGTDETRAGITLTWVGNNQNQGTFEYRFNTKALTPSYPNGYATVRDGDWANRGGTYRVQIRINDASGGYADQVFDIGVDNFAPVADRGHRTSYKIAGSDVDIIGRALDYRGIPGRTSGTGVQEPPDRTIEKIYAWFTKGSNFVNIDTRELSSTVSTDTMTAFENRLATVSKTDDNINEVILDPSNYGTANNVTYPLAAGWLREISEATAAATATNASSRILWMPGTGGDSGDIRWSFRVNTRNLPDGPITLNYVILDNAGNATFYQEDMIVMNNYPNIESVTLHTNNRGYGAVFTTHTNENASSSYRLESFDMSDGYLNSGFISKNMSIGFEVQTSAGSVNGPLYYSLQYVTREKLPLIQTNLNQMIADRDNPNKINLYTIADMGSYSDRNWMDIGVPTRDSKAGTHFVFTPTEQYRAYQPGDPNIASVWRYTGVFEKGPVPKDSSGSSFAVSPETDGFSFMGDEYFNNSPPSGTSMIKEFTGSHPSNDGGINNPSNTAFFLIRVWDSVDEIIPAPSDYSNKNDMLYDAVVIGMNVYLSDGEKPTATLYDLNPYTETAVVGNNITAGNKTDTINEALDPQDLGRNILRGGLFNTGTTRDLIKSGHIEPRSGTTALWPNGEAGESADGYVDGDVANNTYQDGTTIGAKDLVSGRVILRGQARDNQLIREIRVYTSDGSFGPSPGRAILTLQPDSNGIRILQPANGAQAMAYESMDWKTGHIAEWACVWDTEQAQSGAPRQDVTITVTVVDELGSITNENGLTSDPAAKTVDVVPYIRGFERNSLYATKRSRQGWYSFYQGEAGITALGYNLKGSGNTTAMSIVSGTNGTTTLTITPTAQSINSVTFSMPTNAASGKIILNTNVSINGSTEALNHRSNHAQSWNKEYHPYTTGSDLWINKPYAHVWRSQESNTAPVTYFGDNTTGGGSMALQRPGMSLIYSGTDVGRLHGAWASYANAAVYRGLNTNTARTAVENTTDEPYAGTDISLYNGTNNTGVVYAFMRDGQPNLRTKTGTNITATTANTDVSGSTTPSPTDRWKHNRIAMTGNSDYVVTSYDSFNKNLLVSRGANSTTNVQRIDGGSATTGVVNSGTITASNNAGEFSAVDYVTNGGTNGSTLVPVVVYYDQQNDTVRLAYANTTTPAAGNAWTRRYVLNASHSLYRGSGTYVSMKVDSSNNIHLAFFNSRYNTVVYAVGTRTGDFTAYTVDNVVRGGVWTDISVDGSGNPWIVYGDTSRIGNYDGARIAYKSSTFTGTLLDPVTGTSITGWEAVQMPANYTVNDDRLNIEVWPPTVRGGTLGTRPTSDTWNAAIGYGSDMFRVAYFYNPAWKDY